MVSLDVVVFNVLANGGVEMTLSEWNDVAETFALYRANKSFSKCVQIGTVGGKFHEFDPGRSQHVLELISVQWVSIDNQMTKTRVVPQLDPPWK